MDFLGLRTHNLSILSVPAYYFVALLPHAYAIGVATNGDILKWDNRNPRSSTLKSSLQSSLSESQYARYERAESASANALENFPLFASAILVGNMAGLPKDGFDGLNAFVTTWFGLRIAHSVSYIWLGDTVKLSLLRSACWIGTLAVSFRVFWKAAKALGTSGM